MEARSAIGRGLRPYAAAVAADDPMRGRQSEAQAFELALRMQALKGTEELAGVAHVEANAVVAHEIDERVTGLHTELDEGWLAATRELPGVMQQRLERRGHQRRIGLGGDVLRDCN